MNGIKRDKRDKVFSFLVRERANWHCERCGKERYGRALHCSHLVSRRHRAGRWHPRAASAHCAWCHKFLESNPVLFTDWVAERYGHARVDFLRWCANTVQKYTKQDLEDIHQHLQKEHKAMLARRAEGDVGWIDFVQWRP